VTPGPISVLIETGLCNSPRGGGRGNVDRKTAQLAGCRTSKWPDATPQHGLVPKGKLIAYIYQKETMCSILQSFMVFFPIQSQTQPLHLDNPH